MKLWMPSPSIKQSQWINPPISAKSPAPSRWLTSSPAKSRGLSRLSITLSLPITLSPPVTISLPVNQSLLLRREELQRPAHEAEATPLPLPALPSFSRLKPMRSLRVMMPTALFPWSTTVRWRSPSVRNTMYVRCKEKFSSMRGEDRFI